MKSRFWVYVLVLFVPYMAFVGLFPFYNRAEPFILGFPFIYFWIFMCIPLTSLAMYLAYRIDPENEEGQAHEEQTVKSGRA